jgi:hypothetical protein
MRLLDRLRLKGGSKPRDLEVISKMDPAEIDVLTEHTERAHTIGRKAGRKEAETWQAAVPRIAKLLLGFGACSFLLYVAPAVSDAIKRTDFNPTVVAITPVAPPVEVDVTDIGEFDAFRDVLACPYCDEVHFYEQKYNGTLKWYTVRGTTAKEHKQGICQTCGTHVGEGGHREVMGARFHKGFFNVSTWVLREDLTEAQWLEIDPGYVGELALPEEPEECEP